MGAQSKVAHYAQAIQGFNYDQSKPYAEVRFNKFSHCSRLAAQKEPTGSSTLWTRAISRQLWMGTHPSLPSKVVDSGKPLSDLIKANPEQLLGAQIRQKFQADDLPYLFKVLSIGKALSIQAHPDKALGQKLHAQRPDVYKGWRGVCAQYASASLAER